MYEDNRHASIVAFATFFSVVWSAMVLLVLQSVLLRCRTTFGFFAHGSLSFEDALRSVVPVLGQPPGVVECVCNVTFRFTWTPVSCAGWVHRTPPDEGQMRRAWSRKSELRLECADDVCFIWTGEIVPRGHISYCPFWRLFTFSQRANRLRFCGRVTQLIGIAGLYALNYYHFHIDVFAFLLILPESLLSSSYFAYYYNSRFIPDSLELIGLSKRSILLNNGDYVHAERIHFFRPYQGWSVSRPLTYPAAVSKLRDFVLQLTALSPRAPHGRNAIFFSRPRSASRYIPNTHAVVADLAGRLPHLNWSIIQSTSSIAEGARCFNPARVALAAHGAGCLHVTFMKIDAVFVEIQCRVGIDIFHYFELSRVAGVYHVFTAISEMRLHGPNTHEFPIALCGTLTRLVRLRMAQERPINGAIGNTAAQICTCTPEYWNAWLPQISHPPGPRV